MTLKRGIALTPVTALPGSREKIAALKARAELRLTLFRDDEPRLFDPENQIVKVLEDGRTGRKISADDVLLSRAHELHAAHPELNHVEIAERVGLTQRQVWYALAHHWTPEAVHRCEHCGKALSRPECLQCRLELGLAIRLTDEELEAIQNVGEHVTECGPVYQTLMNLRDRIGFETTEEVLRWAANRNEIEK